MAYTKVHEDWEDSPSTATPILAADLEHIEQGISDAAATAETDATTTVKGRVELATSAETTAGTDVTLAVTPAGVKAVADTKAPLSHTHAAADMTATGTRDATTFLRGDNTWAAPAGGGGPLFADPNADRIAFWDDSAGAFAPLAHAAPLNITGTSLTVSAATETEAGKVELATVAETTTGTDTTRATTPAGVKAVADTKAALSHTHAAADIVSLGDVISSSGFDLPVPGNALAKFGVVVDLGSAGAFDAGRVESLTVAYDPNQGRFAGVYTGYTEGSGTEVGAIGLAWSDDLVTWTKAGVLLSGSNTVGAPDEKGATGPLLIFRDGLWHLFYIGLTAVGYEGGTKRLCLVTSPSLTALVWTRRGAVLSPGGSGWRSTAIWHPSIVLHENVWYCFINASGSDAKERIGYATASSLLGPWTFDDTNSPLIDSPAGIEITGDPCVQRMPSGGWRMDFFRYDGTTAHDMYATTTDDLFPLGWTIGYGGNPILVPSETYDSQFAHKPFVCRMGGRVFHFYTAVNTSNRRTVALATQPPLALYVPTVRDDFNRADGALGITALGAKSWTTSGGTGWAIASNRAAWTGTSDGVAAIDSGHTDKYAIQFTAVSVTGQWPLAVLARGASATSYVKIVRDQSSNTWRISLQDGSNFQSVTEATDVVSGDVVRVTVSGTVYRVFVNGTQRAEFTYSSAVVGAYQGVIGSGNLALTIDDFSVSSI